MSQPAPRRSGRVSARLELASDATVDQEIVHGQQMEKKKRPAKRVKVEESIEAAESVKKEEPSNSFAEPNLSRSDENNGSLGAPAKKRRNTKAKNSEKVEIKDEPPESVSATKGKRASKKKAEAEPMPPRVQGSSHYIGAHVSMAGGVETAVNNARRIGANAFALFLRPKMQWAAKHLSAESIDLFPRHCLAHSYTNYCLPHGSYLINLGNADKDKRDKSYECFLDDLKRCETLGIDRYNFHPGSSVGECSKEQACSYIAEAINAAHKVTKSVCVLLENMAGAGNIVGSTFEELRDIINKVDDKNRVGICLDTCHAFAAGYDIRTREGYEATMMSLDEIVGLKYLRGMHLNDSKEGLGAHRDRHQNLGAGQIGLPAFYFIMNDPRLANIPLVLETPAEDDNMNEVWRREVRALYMLSGLAEDESDWAPVRALLAEVQEVRRQGKERQEIKKLASKERKAAMAKALKGKDLDASDLEEDEEDVKVGKKGKMKVKAVKAKTMTKSRKKITPKKEEPSPEEEGEGEQEESSLSELDSEEDA